MGSFCTGLLALVFMLGAQNVKGGPRPHDAACTDKWPGDDGYCSKSVTQRMCYNGYGKEGGKCCKTCSEKFKTGVTGCEFGNKEGDRYCGQFDPAKCPDDEKLREDCCWLCRSDAAQKPPSEPKAKCGAGETQCGDGSCMSLADIGPQCRVGCAIGKMLDPCEFCLCIPDPNYKSTPVNCGAGETQCGDGTCMSLAKIGPKCRVGCAIGKMLDPCESCLCIPDPNYKACGPGEIELDDGTCYPDLIIDPMPQCRIGCMGGSMLDPTPGSCACIPDPNYKVSCGGHEASSCAECPDSAPSDQKDQRAAWCNGECHWYDTLDECMPMY